MSWEAPEPEVRPSAHRHGIRLADILHAYRRPDVVVRERENFDMLVSPGTNGLLLEVGVRYDPEHDADIIIHAMRARPLYTRLWQAAR